MKKDSFPPAPVSSSGRVMLSDDRSFKTLDNNVSVTVFYGSRSDVEKLEEVVLPKLSKTSTSSDQHQIIYPEQPEVLSDQQVEVVSVNDPSSFYVQLLKSWSALEDLDEKLNAVYSGEFSQVFSLPLSKSIFFI